MCAVHLPWRDSKKRKRNCIANMMHKIFFASALLAVASGLPQRNRGGGNGGRQRATAFQQAAQVPQGLSQAQDGSIIMDDTVMVKYV